MKRKENWSGGAAVQDTLVDWQALEDAFENTMRGVHSYLHTPTGTVLRVVDGVVDPPTGARIAADTDYLHIDPVSSPEQYRWMEAYVQTVQDPNLKSQLKEAIVGKGAFRRFKDVLLANPLERDLWFAFRSKHLRSAMEVWLRTCNLTAMAMAMPGGTSQPVGLAGQRFRRDESVVPLRKRLCEIADTLAPRDLAALIAFAEFVTARSQSETAGSTGS